MMLIITSAVLLVWAVTLAIGPTVRVLWRRRRELHSWWYVGSPRP